MHLLQKYLSAVVENCVSFSNRNSFKEIYNDSTTSAPNSKRKNTSKTTQNNSDFSFVSSSTTAANYRYVSER